jgi:hypothetical protein
MAECTVSQVIVEEHPINEFIDAERTINVTYSNGPKVLDDSSWMIHLGSGLPQ